MKTSSFYLQVFALILIVGILPACSDSLLSTLPQSPEATPTEPDETPAPETPSGNDPETSWPSSITAILDLPETSYAYSELDLPAHFSASLVSNFDNTPATNPINDRVATLGRVLFYDTQLSANNTVSCASCHKQASGFSDNAQFSTGFEGGLTERNSMGLTNSRFYANGHFFWDERAATLEEQALMPIQNEVEMGLSLDALTTKLAATNSYPFLFNWAFDDEGVTTERISLALSQFVRSIVSYESKYDAGLTATGTTNRPFENFSATENAGKALFFSQRTNCGSCHADVNAAANPQRESNSVFFFMDTPRNNGLDAGPTNDNGVADITGRNQDSGKFKVSSLRNIELTAPYMHDGRLATLEQVVDHYSNGIQNHPNLDNRLRTRDETPRRMNFSAQERVNLLAFLRTLTDTQLLNNEAYSNPFK